MKTDAQLFSEFIMRYCFYLRTKANIGQREFYNHTNINCSRFEDVNTTCILDTLYDVAQFFGMTPVQFIARSDEYIAFVKRGNHGANFSF